MEIKTCDAQPALCLRLNTQLSTLPQDVADHPERLYQAVTNAKLEPTGPMVFVYRDMSDDMEAPFELEIALPVASTAHYEGEATATTLDKLRYVETVHTGDLRQLGDTYQTFFAQLGSAGLAPAKETREVYTHFVDSNSADNVTHIQVGI